MLLGCRKKDPPIGNNATAQLPPITTTGANTFGCLVNGEVWLPKGDFPVSGLHADYTGGGFVINATKYINPGLEDVAISIYPNSLQSVGTFFLNLSNAEARFTDSSCDLNGIKTDTSNVGKIEIIKFDTVNHIISGTFEFTVYNEACDTIKITQGRFDVNE